MQSVPVLPAADVPASLAWWTEILGFTEAFRDTTPPAYVGLMREGAYVHLAQMSDAALARTVGDQTMIRFIVPEIDALYNAYQARGGKVHPNGSLSTKPWGTREFSAIDPNGVCITFQGEHSKS